MGAGIAQIAALAGHPVLLLDAVAQAMNNLTPATDVADLAGCALVVEAGCGGMHFFNPAPVMRLVENELAPQCIFGSRRTRSSGHRSTSCGHRSRPACNGRCGNAYSNVSHYRKAFDAAVVHHTDDCRELTDLAKLPPTHKRDLRENHHFEMFAVP